MNLFEALHRKTPDERAKFLARASNYITNPAFLSVLARINVDDPTTIGPTCALLRKFDTPEFRPSLVAWIRSA